MAFVCATGAFTALLNSAVLFLTSPPMTSGRHPDTGNHQRAEGRKNREPTRDETIIATRRSWDFVIREDSSFDRSNLRSMQGHRAKGKARLSRGTISCMIRRTEKSRNPKSPRRARGSSLDQPNDRRLSTASQRQHWRTAAGGGNEKRVGMKNSLQDMKSSPHKVPALPPQSATVPRHRAASSCPLPPLLAPSRGNVEASF